MNRKHRFVVMATYKFTCNIEAEVESSSETQGQSRSKHSLDFLEIVR